ncbi:MAG: hypothetical protein KKB37_07320, partial [Alphaproteobacteria bacterium]|nr:hypothetical protein [Alphaproteobacteria bacterium]
PQSTKLGSVMRNPFKWYRFRKPVRDFLIALVIFSAMFVVMSPSRHQPTPIPVLSLFNGQTWNAIDKAEFQPAAISSLSQSTARYKAFGRETLQAINTPLISSLLAVMFASIIAFNFALLRHLRRENASSRRSAWRRG